MNQKIVSSTISRCFSSLINRIRTTENRRKAKNAASIEPKTFENTQNNSQLYEKKTVTDIKNGKSKRIVKIVEETDPETGITRKVKKIITKKVVKKKVAIDDKAESNNLEKQKDNDSNKTRSTKEKQNSETDNSKTVVNKPEPQLPPKIPPTPSLAPKIKKKSKKSKNSDEKKPKTSTDKDQKENTTSPKKNKIPKTDKIQRKLKVKVKKPKDPSNKKDSRQKESSATEPSSHKTTSKSKVPDELKAFLKSKIDEKEIPKSPKILINDQEQESADKIPTKEKPKYLDSLDKLIETGKENLSKQKEKRIKDKSTKERAMEELIESEYNKIGKDSNSGSKDQSPTKSLSQKKPTNSVKVRKTKRKSVENIQLDKASIPETNSFENSKEQQKTKDSSKNSDSEIIQSQQTEAVNNTVVINENSKISKFQQDSRKNPSETQPIISSPDKLSKNKSLKILSAETTPQTELADKLAPNAIKIEGKSQNISEKSEKIFVLKNEQTPKINLEKCKNLPVIGSKETLVNRDENDVVENDTSLNTLDNIKNHSEIEVENTPTYTLVVDSASDKSEVLDQNKTEEITALKIQNTSPCSLKPKENTIVRFTTPPNKSLSKSQTEVNTERPIVNSTILKRRQSLHDTGSINPNSILKQTILKDKTNSSFNRRNSIGG